MCSSFLFVSVEQLSCIVSHKSFYVSSIFSIIIVPPSPIVKILSFCFARLEHIYQDSSTVNAWIEPNLCQKYVRNLVARRPFVSSVFVVLDDIRVVVVDGVAVVVVLVISAAARASNLNSSLRLAVRLPVALPRL